MADLPENLDVIAAAVMEGDFGLLSDFDGTLSRVAPTPARAVISARARRSLSSLSPCLKLVAVVSGRSLEDIRRIVGLEGITYVGNHGLEMWIDGKKETVGDTAAFRQKLPRVKNAVAPLLQEEGVFLEDKGTSATVHYRLSSRPQEIEKTLLKRLEGFNGGLRLMKGKMSLNILPFEVDKGSVTLELIRRFALKSAVYIGDDVTDIDAFTALRKASHRPDFKGFSVAVSSPEAPPELAQEGDFTLSGVAGVERFLSWLRQAVPPAR